ncbi:MarR family winged helix-turn-helix transcriptional regulator [Tunturiibacter lichenicola]|uniref:MarR family winged helix-turn-helix transcriptional regulator n=1 Tax=Tunturiibacter lichenicola TaxID=2051959 RepID=UPI003D9B21EF
MSREKPAQPAVSELRSHIGFWLRFVSNHVSHAFSRKLLDSGVTAAEWVILREIFDTDEIPPSALAEQTGLTRGAISKLIERLVVKKLVSRKEGSDDRRYQRIALSPAGRRLVPTLATLADQNDREFFKPLTGKERQALVATLKKLVHAHDLHKLPTE